MIETVRVDGAVKIPQELATVACHEMNSDDFTLLKSLLRIESVAKQFGVSSQNFTLPQFRPRRASP